MRKVGVKRMAELIREQNARWNNKKENLAPSD
jgi:hypothetical protein